MRLGFTKNRVLPLPEPPITRTFLFRAYFGCFGRLLIISRSVCVSSTLFSNIGVDVWLYILGIAPTCRAVLHALAVFLCVLAFHIDRKPDNDRPDNADKQIHRVQSSAAAFEKAAEKPLPKWKAACRRGPAPGESRTACPTLSKRYTKSRYGGV